MPGARGNRWFGSFARGPVRAGIRFGLLSFAVGLSAATAAHDSPLNPDDPAYLRRQYVWFQAQDARRQQQLRKLHADFQQLDPEAQARMTRVMLSYNAWLDRLAPADRERVRSAPNAQSRLELVRELREREWVETLPKPYRDEYARLEGEARREKVQEWQAEEADRNEEWALAQRHLAENPPGKVPTMFLGEGRAQVEAFLGHLRENLSETERKDLDDARAAADEYGNYFWYALEVVRLADRHPTFPGTVGPKDYASLPDPVKKFLAEADPEHFQTDGIVRTGDTRELRRAQGRWPEFAVELTRHCQKKGLRLPVPLGDCQKDKMPPEVIQFLDRTLELQLRRSDVGKSELEALNRAQESWPDYPRMIVELARKYKVAVPGWTLPGSSQLWDRFRAGKNSTK